MPVALCERMASESEDRPGSDGLVLPLYHRVTRRREPQSWVGVGHKQPGTGRAQRPVTASTMTRVRADDGRTVRLRTGIGSRGQELDLGLTTARYDSTCSLSAKWKRAQ